LQRQTTGLTGHNKRRELASYPLATQIWIFCQSVLLLSRRLSWPVLRYLHFFLKKVSISEKKFVFLHREIAVFFLFYTAKLLKISDLHKPLCHILLTK